MPSKLLWMCSSFPYKFNTSKIVRFGLWMREIRSEQGRSLWHISSLSNRWSAGCLWRIRLFFWASSERCVRGLEAIVARLLKFIDEGAELKEGRCLTWR